MSQCNSSLAGFSENHSVISVSIKKPDLKHLNEFLRLKCAPDLLAKNVFTDCSHPAKEITESMAAYAAVMDGLRLSGKNVSKSLSDPLIQMFDICSGATPRTAAVFAMRTKWKCTAVDPVLKSCDYSIDRLVCYQGRIENLNFKVPDLAVVTLVHGHVKPYTVLRSIKAKEYVMILMPCCMPLAIDYPETFEVVSLLKHYYDWGVHSSKREVKIYNIRSKQC